MSKRIYNSLLCAILGDIIGYGNANIEFNNGIDMTIKRQSDIPRLCNISDAHVINTITEGGISNIKLNNRIYSDDTVFLLSIYKSLKKTLNQSNDKILDEIAKNMVNDFYNDKDKEKRNYGYRTVKSLQRIKEGENWRSFGFSSSAGGSGASMRSMPIGYFYHGIKNRDKLIYLSIMSSRITHNNSTGYLGGLVSALFTAFIFENLDKQKWPFELLKILKSKKILDIIDEITRNFPNEKIKHLQNLKKFANMWDTYINKRFKNNKFISLFNEKENLSYELKFFSLRSEFYYNNFGSKGYLNPGSNGCDSTIIAYDCFMDSQSFESLAYYSMLHVGDSDTTGCIAGALYGAYHSEKVNIPFPHDKISKLIRTFKIST